jgi:hypothetical protein
MATEKPPAGAGAFSATTAPNSPPEEGEPLTVTLERPIGSTESAAVVLEAPSVAVIVTGVGAETVVVVTVKGMIEVAVAVATDAGTDATVEFDDENVTTVPRGATPFKVSVPEDV